MPLLCTVCGIYPFRRERVTPDHLRVNAHCLDTSTRPEYEFVQRSVRR